MTARLKLSVLDEPLAVCRLAPEAALPTWLTWSGDLTAVCRTPEELSLVCREGEVPAEVRSERGWRAFKVAGPLDFALTGILASLAGPLAEADISLFAVSTFDTDYLLVRASDLERAKAVLARSCDFS